MHKEASTNGVEGRPPATLTTTAAGLVLLEGITFLLGSLAHLGRPIRLGPFSLAEPRIIPATVVEGLCAFGLAVSAYALLTRRTWMWTATVAAHTLALAGVLLGMASLARGLGPRTELNDIYHRVMAIVLASALAELFSAGGRRALGRSKAG